VGGTAKVTAIYADEHGRPLPGQIIFYSTNPAVAQVDQSGTVTGRKVGSATIIARFPNGRTDRTSVEVLSPFLLLVQVRSPLRVGETTVAQVRVQRSGPASMSVPEVKDISITWRSSNPAVAIIDEDGRVTPQSPGQTRIIARAPNGQEGSVEVHVLEIN